MGTRVPVHDAVLEAWGSDIATGRRPVGSSIAADQAAAEFGVSRTAVREAARVLESLGMVETRQRVGITVLPREYWSLYDSRVLRWRLEGTDRIALLQNLGELRLAVEPLAARLAADRATPEQCGALSAAVIGMSATSRAANAEEYLRHDIDFHTTLLAASGNPMLADLHAITTAVLKGRTDHSLMPSIANPEALRLHGDVVAAIQAHDGEAAERAAREIVYETAAAITEVAGA